MQIVLVSNEHPDAQPTLQPLAWIANWVPVAKALLHKLLGDLFTVPEI